MLLWCFKPFVYSINFLRKLLLSREWKDNPDIKPWSNNHKFWIMEDCPVQFSRSVVSDSLPPHVLQHSRLPCPSPTPGVYLNLCPLSQWCHPTLILCRPLLLPLQSFPASVSQFFASGGQRIGVSASASVLPMNIQDWFPLGLTGLISLQSKGLSRVFSNTTVQTYQFFGTQLSSQSNSHIHTWPLEKP